MRQNSYGASARNTNQGMNVSAQDPSAANIGIMAGAGATRYILHKIAGTKPDVLAARSDQSVILGTESGMQGRSDYSPDAMAGWSANRPLKELTAAEFTALGGNTLVYVRPISGTEVAALLADPELDSDEILQLVVCGDGTPLQVTASAARVAEWLECTNLGV